MPVEAPTPKRMRRPMTDDDKRALLKILQREDVKKDGFVHVATVCAITGLTQNQVRSALKNEPFWRVQLGGLNPDSVAPTEAGAIDPKPGALTAPGVLISQEDFERMRALLRQQKKMEANDWIGLGMDEKMAARASKLLNLGGAPLLPTMNLVGGGLIKHLMVLEQTLEQDGERISANNLPEESDPEGAPVEDGKKQREWRYCWYAGYKLLLELQKSLHQNQAILAKAVRDMQAANPNGPKQPEKGVYETEATPAKQNAS